MVRPTLVGIHEILSVGEIWDVVPRVVLLPIAFPLDEILDLITGGTPSYECFNVVHTCLIRISAIILDNSRWMIILETTVKISAFCDEFQLCDRNDWMNAYYKSYFKAIN